MKKGEKQVHMPTNSEVQQNFYDIESLSNVFSLCNYRHNENILDIFLLVDDKLDTDGDANNNFVLTDEIIQYINKRIYDVNKNFNGAIQYYDLRLLEPNIHFINTFGAKDNLKTFETLASRRSDFKLFVNDTDEDYDDTVHPYLFGYNSFNYDTTMYALYVTEAFYINNDKIVFKPPTAKQMREHNDNLFTPLYKDRMPNYLQRTKDYTHGKGFYNRENIIRNNMLRSGRHLDVALLNEKMQKVALKRILGMLGFQILESDKVKSDKPLSTLDELADLLAYNTSDVVNLHELFNHKVYKNSFSLKKGLLKTYPELIYEKKANEYAPDISPNRVRTDRLFIDSSSAKLASRSLCPYGNLNDIETVSFMYPSEAKAKELGIPRVNVLDEARKFFYNLYPDKPELQKRFDAIYFYYKNNIENHNFNSSDEYIQYFSEKHPDIPPLPACSMSDIEKFNLALPYFDKNGDPTSCYVIFSTGGIHGAEYNKALYDADMKEFEDYKALHDMVHEKFPDPRMLKEKDPVTKKAWSFTYKDNVYKASEFLKSGSTAAKAEWKNIDKKKPILFKSTPTGNYKLNEKYAFTSDNDCNHEDFTSYYPNLLIMMNAFWNEGLGYDRYAEIFGNKEKYGILMKDKTLSDAERENYSVLRNGTKLVLNSASGAADASFPTPIRMNNQIMSMRIIGQFFTWRIGQAQSYAGASIISTNTDGLFSVFEPEENAKILARESAAINVAIEPEFCHLISKDSNNRMELNADNQIITASGGSLACYRSPDPTKSLAHAAILDYALCEYMRNVDNIHGSSGNNYLYENFDLNKGWVILYNSRFAFPDKAKYLNMYQTIVSSSIGSSTYVYGESDELIALKEQMCSIPFRQDLFDMAYANNLINIMSHYNRIFIVKKDFADKYGKKIWHLNKAAARAVTATQKATRRRLDQIEIQHDPYALAVLDKFNLAKKDIPDGKEARVIKVSGIESNRYVYIENRNLTELTETEKDQIIESLDINAYLTLLSESFNKNWSNVTTDKELDNDDETRSDT